MGSFVGEVLVRKGFGPGMKLVPSLRGLLEGVGSVMKPVPLYASKKDLCKASVGLGFISSVKKLDMAPEKVCTRLSLRSIN